MHQLPEDKGAVWNSGSSQRPQRPADLRRKKRCRHPSAVSLPAKSHRSLRPSKRASDGVQESGNAVARAWPSRRDQPDPPLGQSISSDVPRSTRFVGDLNPEALLLERLDEASGKSRRDRIGLWVTSPDTRHEENGTNPPASNRSPLPNSGPSIDVRSASLSLHQIYVSAVRSCEPLPFSTREYLISIYFSKVNHILPLLEKEPFLRAHSHGTASVFLVRAVCLVAAKDRTAGPYLRLTDGGPVVTSRQFCSDIYNGLVAAMNAGLETDRITRIRILALMSLHCEGYEGAESASMHLCQAIHQAQTAGLHLNRPGRTFHDPLTRLFWCLWTLDKMHASIGGRPIVLADRDIGIEKPTIKGLNARTAFDVWFSVADLLSSVISLYRPSAEVGVAWEQGFPTFEDIAGDNVQGNLDSPTLGAVSMTTMAPNSRAKREQVYLNSFIMRSVSFHADPSPLVTTLIIQKRYILAKVLRLFEYIPLWPLNLVKIYPRCPSSPMRFLFP